MTLQSETKVAASLSNIPGSTWSFVSLEEAAELLRLSPLDTFNLFKDDPGKLDRYAYFKGVWHIVTVGRRQEQEEIALNNLDKVRLPAGWFTKALKRARKNRGSARENRYAPGKSEHLRVLESHTVYTDNGWRMRGCPDEKRCSCHSRRGISDSATAALGLGPVLREVEESFFDNLPFDEAATWEQRFVEAFDSNVDQERLWRQFAEYLLCDPEIGVINYVAAGSVERAFVERAIDYIRRGATRQEWNDLGNEIHVLKYKDIDDIYDADESEFDAAWNVLYVTGEIASIGANGEEHPLAANEATRSTAQAATGAVVNGLIPAHGPTIIKMAEKFLDLLRGK